MDKITEICCAEIEKLCCWLNIKSEWHNCSCAVQHVTGSSAVTALKHGSPLYGMYLDLKACYCVNEAGIASLQLAHLHLQALHYTKAVMNAVLVNFQWFTKYPTSQQQNTSEHCKDF